MYIWLKNDENEHTAASAMPYTNKISIMAILLASFALMLSWKPALLSS